MGSFILPAIVPEFFVSGIGSIEMMGGISRQTLVTERVVRGKVIFVPAVSIIISNANAQIAVLRMARELAVEIVAGRHTTEH